MKVLVAPDKFKGSLSAIAAAEAIQRGFLAGYPEAEIRLAPIADGGEGFAETLCVALGGQWIQLKALDPIGREVDARYCWVEAQKLAVIEMSNASGLWRLSPTELAPLQANTFGTGQLMRHAVQRGARTLLVGLGSSATTDGGIGMAEALGYQFLDAADQPLAAIPANLPALARIRAEHALALPQVIAACDVQNPLLGERGSAHVFSPQKGADQATVHQLELGLLNLAQVVARDLAHDFRDAPGAGAAGGIGFGLLSFCRAEIRSGFTVVADALGLEQSIIESDLVLTGEGRIDGQTLEGKGPAGVAALALRHGIPAVAFGGSITGHPAIQTLFKATVPIVDETVTLPEAMQRGAEFLERAAQRVARLLQIGKDL